MKIFVEMTEEEFDLYKKMKTSEEGKPVYTQKEFDNLLNDASIQYLLEHKGFELLNKASDVNLYGHHIDCYSYQKRESRFVTSVKVVVEES